MSASLMASLGAVQTQLKAPKGQYNSSGKYSYRNCEDILEAVKPLLEKQGLVLLMSDDLVNIGDRYYAKATAEVRDSTDSIFVTAYAREEETKKGMDASQITGAASSYARKYALNGLFLIDDTKDADATNDHGKSDKAESKPVEKKALSNVLPIDLQSKLGEAVKYKGISDRQQIVTILNRLSHASFGVDPFLGMSNEQGLELLENIKNTRKEALEMLTEGN